jgi:hypothetical protein
MITIEKKIQIMWRNTSSYFEKKNVEVIKQIIRTRALGTSTSAINSITRNTEEMKSIMPLVLGLGHGGGESDQAFTQAVNNYWNSLTYRINFPGTTWEIGMTFDVTDTNIIRAGHIKALTEKLRPVRKVSKTPKVASKDDTDDVETEEWSLTDTMLAEYVMGTNDNGKLNVPVEERYRYGVPIKPAEFLLWQYALVHGNVANSAALLKNSTKMEFYLVDETLAKKERFELHKVKVEAQKLYLDTIVNPNDVADILAVLKKKAPFDTAPDEVKIINEQILEDYMTIDPQAFIDVAKSVNLKTLAKIERYINAGILRRLDNTNIVVDAENAEVVLGHSANEQLAFFANPANKAIIADFSAKFKSLLTVK